jgi:hypothetical protein
MYTVSSELGYTTTRSAVRQPRDGSPASGWLLLFIFDDSGGNFDENKKPREKTVSSIAAWDGLMVQRFSSSEKARRGSAILQERRNRGLPHGAQIVMPMT